jgi:hypothetical protein
VHDPVAGLLFTGLSRVARLVLLNGEVIVEGGRPTRVDPGEVARQAREQIPVDSSR